MIQDHLALIPLHDGRRAALRAIGEVEHRLSQGKRLPEYAWAHAFFRHLTGSKRIGLKEINTFALTLTDRECARRAYQAQVGQAEIDLAFQTPDTVRSWFARWRQTDISENVLDDMFFRWSERFPSLATLERWQWYHQPHWALMTEVHALAKEAPAHLSALERWMVPNKLVHQTAGHNPVP
jgi:hypothetical protein